MEKRPIKFRAWDKKAKIMHPHVQDWYDTLTHEDGEPYQAERSFGEVLDQPEVYEVMQFTGLKDKAGKEIYEGDLLRIYWPSGRISESKVIWDFGSWQIKGFGLFSNAQEEWLEVIGNVYETPEIV